MSQTEEHVASSAREARYRLTFRALGLDRPRRVSQLNAEVYLFVLSGSSPSSGHQDISRYYFIRLCCQRT